MAKSLLSLSVVLSLLLTSCSTTSVDAEVTLNTLDKVAASWDTLEGITNHEYVGFQHALDKFEPSRNSEDRIEWSQDLQNAATLIQTLHDEVLLRQDPPVLDEIARRKLWLSKNLRELFEVIAPPQ